MKSLIGASDVRVGRVSSAAGDHSGIGVARLGGFDLPAGVLKMRFKPGYGRTYYLFCGEEKIIGMEPARIDISFRADACFLKVADIVDRFAVKGLNIPYKGIAGRKTAVILLTS